MHLGLENLKLNIFVLVFVYKPYPKEYETINKLISLLFLVIYKSWMSFMHDKYIQTHWLFWHKNQK